jgi:hypothetical protein
MTRRRFLEGTLLMGAAVATDQLLWPGSGLARSRVHRWSDPRTWGGRVPGRRSVVRITKPVLLDVDARVAGIEVTRSGSLTFHPHRSIKLSSSGNIVVRGTLRMAPASADEDHRLVFLNIDERRFKGETLNPVASDVGLWVIDSGVLKISGTPKRAWTRVYGSVAQGAKTMWLLEDPTGWRVGDEVAITPTLHPSEGGHAQAFDVARITAVKGRSVTLSKPTTFAHPEVSLGPNKTLTAEVLNLTRNVNIEGTRGGRTHIFTRSHKPQTIKYLGVRHMGPRQRDKKGPEHTKVVVGRWPVHFHHAMGGSRGSIVQGVVAREVGSHAYVTHMSHGVKFRSCIAYDVLEDPYWWDKFDKTNDTVVDSCVAAKVDSDSKDQLGTIYGFVLGLGSGNVARNCVATGIMGTPRTDTGGYGWLEKNGGKWIFEDNVSHNNLNDGLFNWLNSGDVHSVARFITYRNGRAGLEVGAYENRHQFEECISTENRYSVILHAVSKGTPPLLFNNCVLNGEILVPRRLGGQAGAPVLFADGKVAGRITVDHTNSVAVDNWGLYDFVRMDIDGRDLEPEDFNLILLWPGSRIRVQRRDETAFEFNDLLQVSDIPPFA